MLVILNEKKNAFESVSHTIQYFGENKGRGWEQFKKYF